MSSENLNILYVGDIEEGRALFRAAKRVGWHVYLPAELLEALAMTITYYPDVVIIDHTPRCAFAEEVYMHLRSLTGEHPSILVLTNLERWNQPSAPNVHLLPYTTDNEDILDRVKAIVESGIPTLQ